MLLVFLFFLRNDTFFVNPGKKGRSGSVYEFIYRAEARKDLTMRERETKRKERKRNKRAVKLAFQWTCATRGRPGLKISAALGTFKIPNDKQWRKKRRKKIMRRTTQFGRQFALWQNGWRFPSSNPHFFAYILEFTTNTRSSAIPDKSEIVVSIFSHQGTTVTPFLFKWEINKKGGKILRLQTNAWCWWK